MRIGIDISQLAYANTGVANYLQNLVKAMVEEDNGNEYVLFYSSLRQNPQSLISGLQANLENITIKKYRIPPIVLSFLWNKLHVLPIEWLIGNVDVFITSDWTEPPTLHAKKMTIIYDMIVFTHPEETDVRIVLTQKQKLQWVKRETDRIFAISEATKRDIVELLDIKEHKVSVIYPGL